MTDNLIKEKKINKYEFKLIKINDLKKYDYLVIELSINAALQELLKEKFIIKDEPQQDYIMPSGFQSIRYLAKGYIMRELYSDYKLIFSDTDLINKGKMIINFESANSYEGFLRELRNNFKRLIEIIRDYNNINVTLTIEN